MSAAETITGNPWSDIEKAALAAFSASINLSAPSLVAAIRRSTRYIYVDHSAKEIVIDRRAVMFGIISSGLTDTPSLAHGNTATWFAAWLDRRLPPEALAQVVLKSGLTGTDKVLELFTSGFNIVVSISMKAVLPKASEYAKRTVNRRKADLRHLFTAMLEPHGTDWPEFADLGWRPSSTDLTAFRAELMSRIASSHESGEMLDEWRSILSISEEEDTADLSPLARTAIEASDHGCIVRGYDLAASAILRLATGIAARRAGDQPPEAQIVDVCESLFGWSDRLLAGHNLLFIKQITSRLRVDTPGLAQDTVRSAKFKSAEEIQQALAMGLSYSISSAPNEAVADFYILPRTLAADANLSVAGVRHLVAALLSRSDVGELLQAAGADVNAAREAFPDIDAAFFPAQDKSVWRSLFLGRRNVSIATMRPDEVPEDPRSDDRLDLRRYADALGALIAADTQKPPLSIAVFGPWGSGKSFFMRMIQAAVSQFSKSDARNADDKPAYKQRVVSIWFNAWHYVEGNLWASLMHAILMGLQEELSPKRTGPTFGQLLEKLNIHTAVQLEAATELRNAQNHLAETKQALTRALAEASSKRQAETKIPSAGQILDEVWGMALDEIRPPGDARARKAWVETIGRSAIKAATYLGRPELAHNLTALRDAAGGAADTDAALKARLGEMQALLEEAQASASQGASLLGWLANIRFNPGERHRLLQTTIGIFAILLLLTILLQNWGETIAAAVSAVVAVVAPLLVAAGVAIRWAKTHVGEATRAFAVLGNLRKQIERTQHRKLSENDDRLQAARQARIVAEAEVTKRQADVDAANLQAKQAETDLKEATSAQRLMNYVAQRLADGEYQRHLGLIHTIRDDMNRLQDILKDVHPKEASIAGAEQPVQRIVLYIDDLDRCPPQRVVEVLEAVHLLLAFPLFVVVVGVDVRWVSQALRNRYPGQLGIGGDIASPTDYLEKVFQIPFWLPPMDRNAGRRLLALAIGPAQMPAPLDDAPKIPGGERVATPTVERTAGQNIGGSESETSVAVDAESVKVTERPQAPIEVAEALQIDALERGILLNMAEAVGISPRRTNRFANLYRLLKASLSPVQRRDFLSEDGQSGTYRGALILLAVATGAPSVARILIDRLREAPGPDAEAYLTALLNIDRAKLPSSEWTAFVAAKTQILAEQDKGAMVLSLRAWAPEVGRFMFNAS